MGKKGPFFRGKEGGKRKRGAKKGLFSLPAGQPAVKRKGSKKATKEVPNAMRLHAGERKEHALFSREGEREF